MHFDLKTLLQYTKKPSRCSFLPKTARGKNLDTLSSSQGGRNKITEVELNKIHLLGLKAAPVVNILQFNSNGPGFEVVKIVLLHPVHNVINTQVGNYNVN